MVWCPFATVVTGAPKYNSGARKGKGAVLHSMEGYLNHALDIVRDPNSGVSWHFSVSYDGSLYEHYPIEAKCWHAHAIGNENYIGIEHEGVAGEPETDEQVRTDIRLLAWLAETEDWPGFVRCGTLWEHHEIPGNPTACPSGRILWDKIIAGLLPAPVLLDGIGVRADDDATLDLWPEIVAWLGGRQIIGVGAHFDDGHVETLWPK